MPARQRAEKATLHSEFSQLLMLEPAFLRGPAIFTLLHFIRFSSQLLCEGRRQLLPMIFIDIAVRLHFIDPH